MDAKKKLYKSNDKKLGGVCSGIAEYFDIDPTIVRLIWAIVTLASLGTGIIAYILCAFILPDPPNVQNMKSANETQTDSTHIAH
ncbi:MAG: PspC domain-containing protein [Treponema sp.]|nr:PspC domain-containing protein [Treponema sp.]